MPKSYRTPLTIHRLSSEIVSRIKNRYDKKWDPKTENGEVEWVSHEEQLNLSIPGTWMLLSRSKFFLNRMRKICRQQGYGYKIYGKSSLDSDETRAIISWERIRKNESIAVVDAKNLIKFIPFTIKLEDQPTYSFNDLGLPVVAKNNDWMTMLRSIPPEEREYLRSCLRNGEKFGDEPRISISTIHQVKGGEADNVALVTDMGRLSWENSTSDEEIRVWYVALTRTRKNLFLIQPRTLKYFDL